MDTTIRQSVWCYLDSPPIAGRCVSYRDKYTWHRLWERTAKLIILLITIYVLQCVSSPHRVPLSKESSQSMCDDLRRLNCKPVAVLRKMFNVCAPKLFGILWCNKGIFVSPEHQGRDMRCQVMQSLFPLNEILRIDATVQFQHHAAGLRFC